MKSVALLALASAAAALSGVTVSGHEYKALQKRHRAIAARASHPTPVVHTRSRRAGPRRMIKRKTPGTGDSTEEPSNIATDTFTAKQGCAIWHTVLDGEVCLGLIDKSSSSFTLAKFLQYNPSLSGNCDNLITGQAYCVDITVAETATTSTKSKSSTKTTSSAAAVTTTAAARVAAVKQTKTTKTTAAQEDVTTSEDDDTEDCDDDDSDNSDDDDDSDDCDSDDSDDGDSADVSSSTVSASTGTDSTDTSSSNSNSGSNSNSSSGSSSNSSNGTAQKKKASAAKSSSAAASSSTTQAQSGKLWGGGNSNGDGNNESGDSEDSWDNATSSSSASAATSTSSSSSSSSSDSSLDQSGTATWYTQNGNAGNCGDTNSDSALIVALYTPQYQDGANCGKTVKLVNTANGNSITAKVADSCPSCETNGNIDLSVAAFKSLSDDNMGLGVLSVKWGYV